uniref:Uncharacterized protein n=1 Tax=Arundo donax TaxID=35708 RepID=A0A0A9HZB8_ARUDO
MPSSVLLPCSARRICRFWVSYPPLSNRPLRRTASILRTVRTPVRCHWKWMQVKPMRRMTLPVTLTMTAKWRISLRFSMVQRSGRSN